MRVINSILLVLLAMILVGCATPEPVVRIVTVRVEVPVPIACKEETPLPPAFCFDRLAETSNIYEMVQCLLSDRKLSQGYEIELTATLKACK